MTGAIAVAQLLLPGQTHAAEGPHDMTGMYVMHHAFRRDLHRFVAAVSSTPLQATGVWHALAARWAKYEHVLHHHHTIEDEALWPIMHATAVRTGSDADRRTLEQMQAEHGIVAPILDAVSTDFRTMVDEPSEYDWRTLADHIVELRIALTDHLRREETEALPLAQRTMTTAEWHTAEQAAGKGYPAGMLPFLVPWALDGLPRDGRERMLGLAGRPYAVLHRLTRPRYARHDAVAFRYT